MGAVVKYDGNNKSGFLPYLLTIFLALMIFSDLIAFYTGVTIVDKAVALFLIYIFIILILARKNIAIPLKIGKVFLLFVITVLLIFIINNVIINIEFFHFPSFMYQVFKLGIIFIFIPIVFFPQRTQEKTIQLGVYLFFVFICLNLFVIILQYLFGIDVIQYLGMNIELIEHRLLKTFRPTGISRGGINVIANAALFIFIITFYVKQNLNRFRYYFINRKIINLTLVGCIIVIFLSTSKHVLLLLFLLPFFFIKDKRLLVVLAIIWVICSFALYYFNVFLLQEKLNMYYYFFTNYGDLNLSLVEYRARMIYMGMQIIVNYFPFGLGLGTWGDFSSSFNPYVSALPYGASIMSDTYAIHLVVEQGVFAFMYLLVIYFLLNKDRIPLYMFLCIMASFLVTMGFGSSIYPYIIAFGMAIINCIWRFK